VELTLADVDACEWRQAEWLDARDDRLRGADGAGRPVEGGEEAVACGVALLAAEACELPADERVALREQISPAAVPRSVTQLPELCPAMVRRLLEARAKLQAHMDAAPRKYEADIGNQPGGAR
jgi:hypothetical protein